MSRLFHLCAITAWTGRRCVAAKIANIDLRVDPELKAQAEELYSGFRISVTDAINMFLRVSLLQGGLPFELRQPRYNTETEVAMAEARAISEGKIPAKRYQSVTEIIDDILAED